jgi:hypothetical protein
MMSIVMLLKEKSTAIKFAWLLEDLFFAVFSFLGWVEPEST